MVATALVALLPGCVESEPVPAAAEPSLAGPRVHVAMAAIDAQGPRAQQALSQALAALRKDPAAVPTLLAKLGAVKDRTTIERWKLTYILMELADPRAVPALVAVAREQLPQRPVLPPSSRASAHRAHLL